MPDEFTDVPEADAWEQRLEVVVDEEEVARPTLDLETPEADALEQALAVPGDDDYDLRS